MDSDMISNLPENVKDEILIRLRITDAVRTSVLSTKWRYKWTTITQLVFHDHNMLPSPPHNNNNNRKDKLINIINRVLRRSPHDNKDKLINFIDRVLLLHIGFIHKFELSTTMYLSNSSSTIDYWILFLSRKNIKEFILNFSPRGRQGGEGYYRVPTCFFSSQQICTLELHWCVLKPPPITFTGFSNLKNLLLHRTKFVDDKGGFESLISKCPLLERLTLEMFDSVDHLNICSPNLKYLCLYGNFQDFCFENTPLLSDVSIHLSYTVVENFVPSETGNAVKVLGSLPNLRKFVVGQCFLQFLCLSKIPEKLPFTCNHLNNLSLRLNFECVNHICVTLCLLNSSPNLRELNITSYSFCKFGHKIENFWEERTLIDWNMSGLQIVKITNIEGFESELEFIKLLLTNSPMLEMLSIRSSKHEILDCAGLKLLKELLIFPRASPKAKIQFLERTT